MQREVLLLGEMIDAAEQSRLLVTGIDVERLESDRQRRDALLWNFTVLGEASAQLDAEFKKRYPHIGLEVLGDRPRQDVEVDDRPVLVV